MQLLRCSLINFTTISISLDDISQFDSKKLIVKNGEISLLVDSFTSKNNEISLHLKSEVNIKVPCAIQYNDIQRNVNYFSFYSTPEFDERFYTDEHLGITYSKEGTTFRLWSPIASFVNLLIYENGDTAVSEKPKKFKMTEKNGLWECKVRGNLKGYFYTYELKVHGNIHEAVDPYAKACGINGLRGAIVDLKDTNPQGFQNHPTPKTEKYTDAIIYETSIRDMSIHPDSGIHNKGKFLGLTEENTNSSKDVSTGLSHILELGVTHIQLMPVFDYSYVSVDEKHPYKYNWGYDPQNYNVPEGSYASDPYSPTCRIYELKKLVQHLHKHNLSVIMDVVYNHIFTYADSDLEKIFPGYYFRQFEDGTYCNGSGCGNDIASERSMARKLIIDSLLYWTREYHIDGFRFDLMGIHDIETMSLISQFLNGTGKKIMLYGEGWYLNTNLKEQHKANIYNSYKLKDVGFFNDSIRDSLKGTVFNIGEKGFVSGKEGLEEVIKFCAAGCSLNFFNRPATFLSPEQDINYSSCHDNYTLWDKLKLSNPEASEEELKEMNKLSDGIILTSLGVPFLHSGAEFCRTKNGIENSYNSTDSINRMDWHRKSHYLDVFEYYKGLIKLRKEHSAFRLHSAAQVAQHLEFLPTGRCTVAFMLKDHANGDKFKNIVVIYNGLRNTSRVDLPEGDYKVVVNKHTAGTEPIECITAKYVDVEPTSMMVLYSE